MSHRGLTNKRDGIKASRILQRFGSSNFQQRRNGCGEAFKILLHRSYDINTDISSGHHKLFCHQVGGMNVFCFGNFISWTYSRTRLTFLDAKRLRFITICNAVYSRYIIKMSTFQQQPLSTPIICTNASNSICAGGMQSWYNWYSRQK